MNSPITKTLWMGDIDSFIDEEFIYKIFRNININIKNVRIIRDKQTGQKQDFESREEAMYFLENFNGKQILNTNRFFKLNWAVHNASRTGSATSISENTTTTSNPSVTPNYIPQKFIKKQKHVLEFTIYVGELDPKVDEEILTNFFKEYRSIVSIKIITDPNTKLSRGYGFIKFTNYFEFQRAMKEMNGRLLFGKIIKVNQAGPKKNYADNMNEKVPHSSNNNAGNLNNLNNSNNLINKSNGPNFYSNYRGNNYSSSPVYDFPHHPQRATQFHNNINDCPINSGNFITSYANYGNISNSNSECSTRMQSSDSYKSTNSNSNLTVECSNSRDRYEENSTNSQNNEHNVENFSIEKIIETMQSNNKLKADESPFSLLKKYLTFSNLCASIQRSLSNFNENKKCPLSNFLYYYNIIDFNRDVNNLDQFYISFSKYGHTYECIDVEKSKLSGRQDYLLNSRDGYCNKSGESFYNSENSAMGTN